MVGLETWSLVLLLLGSRWCDARKCFSGGELLHVKPECDESGSCMLTCFEYTPTFQCNEGYDVGKRCEEALATSQICNLNNKTVVCSQLINSDLPNGIPDVSEIILNLTTTSNIFKLEANLSQHVNLKAMTIKNAIVDLPSFAHVPTLFLEDCNLSKIELGHLPSTLIALHVKQDQALDVLHTDCRSLPELETLVMETPKTATERGKQQLHLQLLPKLRHLRAVFPDVLMFMDLPSYNQLHVLEALPPSNITLVPHGLLIQSIQVYSVKMLELGDNIKCNVEQVFINGLSSEWQQYHYQLRCDCLTFTPPLRNVSHCPAPYTIACRNSSKRVRPQQWCDGTADCSDESDESTCLLNMTRAPKTCFSDTSIVASSASRRSLYCKIECIKLLDFVIEQGRVLSQPLTVTCLNKSFLCPSVEGIMISATDFQGTADTTSVMGSIHEDHVLIEFKLTTAGLDGTFACEMLFHYEDQPNRRPRINHDSDFQFDVVLDRVCPLPLYTTPPPTTADFKQTESASSSSSSSLLVIALAAVGLVIMLILVLVSLRRRRSLRIAAHQHASMVLHQSGSKFDSLFRVIADSEDHDVSTAFLEVVSESPIYPKGRLLRHGQFGEILAMSSSSSSKAAEEYMVFVCAADDMSADRMRFLLLARLMHALGTGHASFLRVHSVWAAPLQFGMRTEFVACTLLDHVRLQKQDNYLQRMRIIQQLLSGMTFLEQSDVVHGALCLEHVWFTSLESVKIAGFDRHLQDVLNLKQTSIFSSHAPSHVASPQIAIGLGYHTNTASALGRTYAPEVVREGSFSTASDVFAFGHLVLELAVWRVVLAGDEDDVLLALTDKERGLVIIAKTRGAAQRPSFSRLYHRFWSLYCKATQQQQHDVNGHEEDSMHSRTLAVYENVAAEDVQVLDSLLGLATGRIDGKSYMLASCSLNVDYTCMLLLDNYRMSPALVRPTGVVRSHGTYQYLLYPCLEQPSDWTPVAARARVQVACKLLCEMYDHQLMPAALHQAHLFVARGMDCVAGVTLVPFVLENAVAQLESISSSFPDGHSILQTIVADCIHSPDASIVSLHSCRSACELSKLVRHAAGLSHAAASIRTYASMDSFRLIRSLGSGQYGTVQLFHDVQHSELVAVKTLKAKELLTEFEQEKEMMILAQHPNLLGLKGVVMVPDPALVVEYLSLGSMDMWLKEQVDRNSIRESLYDVMYQVCGGMCYLASCNIVHRDLAARNVLLGFDMTAKVADYGLSRVMSNSSEKEGDCYYRIKSQQPLPLRWLAPEMFSLGALPLGDATDQQVIKMLLEGMRAAKKNPRINLSVFESETERVPAWLRPVVLQCTAVQQANRPSFTELRTSLSPLMWEDTTHSLPSTLEEESRL